MHWWRPQETMGKWLWTGPSKFWFLKLAAKISYIEIWRISIFQISHHYLKAFSFLFSRMICFRISPKCKWTFTQCTMEEIHSPRLTMVWPGFEPVISWCVWNTLPLYRLSYRFDSIIGKNGVQKMQFFAIFHSFPHTRPS